MSSLASDRKIEQGLGPVAQRILRTLHEIGGPVTLDMLAREAEVSPLKIREEARGLLEDGLIEEVGHIHTHDTQEPRLGMTEKGYRVSYRLIKGAP